jgi:hypothetical protein
MGTGDLLPRWRLLLQALGPLLLLLVLPCSLLLYTLRPLLLCC